MMGRTSISQRLLALAVSAALLTLSGLGCAIGQSVVVVTATPSPEPTSTFIPATSTPIPTPTIAPSPTAAPFVAIAQAHAALQNGDYQTAVGIYKSVLQQPVLSVDPSLRAQAAFGLGEGALREGLFADSVAAMTSYITENPTDSQIPEAYFLRGDAYLGLSQWAKAIADFQAFLKGRPGIIDSYAYERIGDAYLALGQPTQALTNYDLAASSSRGLKPMLTLREKVAAAFLNARSIDKAIAQYDAILAAAQDDDYKAGIALAAADALLRFGSATTAYGRYQEILAKYPMTFPAYRAMQALLKAGMQVDSLLRGKISFNSGDYSDVIITLYNYTSNTPIAKIDPSVYLMLGRAYREVGNIAAANTSFQTIIDNYATNELVGDAWLEQGRTLFLQNNYQGAIDRYKALAEKYPNSSQAPEALWRAGYIYSTLGNQEQSLATFEILGTKYPKSQPAMDGLFQAGMTAYNQGNPGRAQRFFSLLAQNGTGDLKAAGYLWLGRLYQINKQNDLAVLAYREAAKADPGGYYSLRATDLLAGRGPFVAPAALDWSYNSPAEIAEAEAWLRSTFKITTEGALWPLSPVLANDPRMARGNELWAAGAYEDAKGEFAALTEDNKKNPLALYQLASFYYRSGLYRECIETAAVLIDGANIQTYDAPKYIASLRYPIAYYDLVLPTAQKYGVDPLLVFSVIRQESLFQGFATSYAQAQGLMQIIPSTGTYIAQKLNWPNYQNSELYRPFVNVPFGIYYLAEQLRTFDGNVYAALAAYNGGPGNSADWLRISNGDPDLFLQAVSYDETKLYITRIYEQYEVYRAVYGTK